MLSAQELRTNNKEAREMMVGRKGGTEDKWSPEPVASQLNIKHLLLN